MNSNPLAELQSKNQNYNLLIPSATSVQINPFYKCTVMEVKADISQNSGDVFVVGKSKTSDSTNGKPMYEDVYALAKPALMRMATAAGIQFHPEYTTVKRENENTYVGTAYGAVRLPDGSFKTHKETKRICLDDEEAKYRLEFADKAVLGITDNKQAAAAAEMFKGNWKDSTNKWGDCCKAYVIAEEDRDRYVERSVLVNMTLLRKTASEKAQTGAILRVIRALLGIKNTYTIEELKKPFVVPTVTFAPDYNEPTVRQAMLQQGMNSMANMFGTANAAPITTIPFADDSIPSSDDFNADDNFGNPAFMSDVPDDEYVENYQPEPPYMQEIHPQETREDCICSNCGASIPDRVRSYSVSKWGRPLCFRCQKEVGK